VPDSDVHDVLIFLTSLLNTKHHLFSLIIIVSKLDGLKGRNFHGRPRATLTLATPLSRLQSIDCTKHVGKK